MRNACPTPDTISRIYIIARFLILGLNCIVYLLEEKRNGVPLKSPLGDDENDDGARSPETDRLCVG